MQSMQKHVLAMLEKAALNAGFDVVQNADAANTGMLYFIRADTGQRCWLTVQYNFQVKYATFNCLSGNRRAERKFSFDWNRIAPPLAVAEILAVRSDPQQ